MQGMKHPHIADPVAASYMFGGPNVALSSVKALGLEHSAANMFLLSGPRGEHRARGHWQCTRLARTFDRHVDML